MDCCLCSCSLYFIIFILTVFILNKLLRSLKLNNLENRPILITGCDTGFGRQLALKLSRENIPVIAGCLTNNGAKSLVDEVETFKGKINTIIIDVSNDDSVKNAVKHVEQIIGDKKLWAIVNNAGILIYEGASEWISIESYKKTLEVNTFGAIRVCKAFLPLLRKSKGRIVTTISCAGRISIVPLATYSVSKYATEAYMDILRREMKQFGISCHILEPGVYKTPLVSSKKEFLHSRKAFDNLSDEIKNIYGEDYLNQIDKLYYQTLEERANPNINEVVDAYFHALTSRFPYLRYAVGLDAKLVYVPASLLPTYVQDLIIQWVTFSPIADYTIENKSD